MPGSLFHKVAGLMLPTLSKSLQQNQWEVNFANFLRAAYGQNICKGLLLFFPAHTNTLKGNRKEINITLDTRLNL